MASSSLSLPAWASRESVRFISWSTLRGHNATEKLWILEPCSKIHVCCLQKKNSTNLVPSLQDKLRPTGGPRRAAQQPAAWLLSIIWLSCACHVVLVPETQPGICTDTYLVGVTLSLLGSITGSSGYMQQQSMHYCVGCAEAAGPLTFCY